MSVPTCKVTKQIGMMALQCFLDENHAGPHRDFDQLTWESKVLQQASALETHLADLQRENERLKEWKQSILNRLKHIPAWVSGAWAGDKEEWGFNFEFIGWMDREITSLRQQLAAAQAERDEMIAQLTEASRLLAEKNNAEMERITQLEAELARLRSI